MQDPHLSKISRRRFFYYGFAGLAGLTGAGLSRYLPRSAIDHIYKTNTPRA